MIVGQETKIEGRWWITGKSGPAYFGSLSHSQNSLQLIVKIPQDLTVDEVMLQSVDAPADVPEVIVGRNANNQPITLFGCLCLPQIAEGLRTFKIDAIAAINGLELAGWTEPAVRAISIEIDPVSTWLGGKTLVQTTQNDGLEAFSLPAPIVLSFPVRDDVEFRIWCSTGSSWRQDETCFTQDSTVWLQFNEARSLEELSDKWIPWVNRLFSLLLGTGIRPRSITCHRERFFGEQSKPLADKGELLRKGGRPATESKEISPLTMITRHSELAADLGKIIQEMVGSCRTLRGAGRSFCRRGIPSIVAYRSTIPFSRSSA
jgi:hypothetical protein